MGSLVLVLGQSEANAQQQERQGQVTAHLVRSLLLRKVTEWFAQRRLLIVADGIAINSIASFNKTKNMNVLMVSFFSISFFLRFLCLAASALFA